MLRPTLSSTRAKSTVSFRDVFLQVTKIRFTLADSVRRRGVWSTALGHRYGAIVLTLAIEVFFRGTIYEWPKSMTNQKPAE
jgi:hypothetical protein